MNYKNFKKQFGDPKHWSKENVSTIMSYAESNSIDTDFILQRAISKGSSKEVICQIIMQCRKKPSDLNKMKQITSTYMQSKAVENIMARDVKQDFLPFVISALILEGKPIPEDSKPEVVANGAMKAIIKKPSAIPEFSNLLEDYLTSCDSDDICNAALASKEGMKFILSILVPRILKNDAFGISILQRIASHPDGKPAILVGNDIRVKCGINCFL